VLLADEVTLVAVDDQEQFWRALQERSPDVVILDVDMPDITGIELCRVMRTDERWQQTGVIFLTAHRDAPTLHKVFAAGADDMVVKPIIGPELRARVNSRIERTELHRRLAETDGLTGLANRATTERLLDRALTEAAASRPLSVALVDLDHFKRVNDVHGHRSGDDVLRRFAEVVALGEPSFAGRWGGEEFLVGFEGVTAADAVERLTIVLDALRRRRFVDADGATFHCTFSAGVAEHPTDGVDGTELVRAADGALYEAKARGRSQVVSVATLVASRPEQREVDVVTVVADETVGPAVAAGGWRVATLADGHEAVRRMAGPLADLAASVVVLDAEAAGMDAIAVLRRLRAARLGVAVVVAAPSAEREEEAARAGAVATLASPIDVDHLRALVGRLTAAVPVPGGDPPEPDAG
jgi:diguanylate cyclase (GGDEF)-like protein